MAGACPTSLSIAVAQSGGMGACGALVMQPDAIISWVREFRSASDGSLQLNLWIPDDQPQSDPTAEQKMKFFLKSWIPDESVPGAVKPTDFTAQCEAILAAKPEVVSSMMGIYSATFIEKLKKANIKWLATATTVTEALAAEAAGADAIVAQGSEAGGHRGAFNPQHAERKSVGLFALLPAVVDAVNLPVVAAGGIADGRGIAAALTLGASAVQIGTGYLRCPEANIATAWSDAIAQTLPEDTLVTRAFSGRAGRSIATRYAIAMESADSPTSTPYPIQRKLTQQMRDAGTKQNDIDRIQAWAGQSARLAKNVAATELTTQLWLDAESYF